MRSGVKVCHAHTHTLARALHSLTRKHRPSSHCSLLLPLSLFAAQQQQPEKALTFRGQKSNMKTDCPTLFPPPHTTSLCLPLLSLSLHLARVSFASRCADFCLSAGRHLNFSAVSSTQRRRRRRRHSSLGSDSAKRAGDKSAVLQAAALQLRCLVSCRAHCLSHLHVGVVLRTPILNLILGLVTVTIVVAIVVAVLLLLLLLLVGQMPGQKGVTFVLVTVAVIDSSSVFVSFSSPVSLAHFGFGCLTCLMWA